MTMMPVLTPKVTWKPEPILNVMSGVLSLTEIPVWWDRAIADEGEPVDVWVRWARAELIEAEAAERDGMSDLARRGCVHAVGHATRALDGMLDAYLERDYLGIHLRDRAMFKEKLGLLKKRLGEDLPWRIIPPLVSEPRNLTEHDRIVPTIHETGLAVDSAAAIVDAMRRRSEPLSWGPGALGKIFMSIGGKDGEWPAASFHGFDGPFALIVRNDAGVPMLGAGVASDSVTAEVIYAPLVDLGVEKHIELLEWWDGRLGHRSRQLGDGSLKAVLRAAGLEPPSGSSQSQT